MIKPSKTTLSQVLPGQANILQPILADDSHLTVTRLNDDDAIAQPLKLCLADIPQLFASIAHKHHHSCIPASVYRHHLSHTFITD